MAIQPLAFDSSTGALKTGTTALTAYPGSSSVASQTHAATGKTTPVDADEVPIADSAASFGIKKLTWANLKATIKSYYDTVTATLTNKDLTSGTNTFPTFNQSTTGSAAKWTTARNLAGNSVDGSATVAFANKFIVQGTTDTGLSAAQFLGALGTGLVKNTTTTGVLSIATAGTDYASPALYNVADHGVAVDGTTDVTTALNTAIAASPAGATVVFPAVTYQVSAPIILLPNRTYVGLGHAYGVGAIIKQKNSSNITNGAGLSGILVAQGWSTNATVCDNPILIENLCVDGNKANNGSSTACGIVLTNFWSHVRHCYIINTPKHGVLLTDTTVNGSNVVTNSCSENQILSCKIDNTGGDGIKQISGNGASNQDGYCVDTIIATTTGSGVNFQRAAGWTFRRLNLYAIKQSAIFLDNCFGTSVVDNYIEDFAGEATAASYYYGILVGQLNGRGSHVRGNFIGCGEVSASVGGYQYINVTAGSSQTDANVIVTDNHMHGPASPTNKGIGLVSSVNSGGVLRLVEANNRVAFVNAAYFSDPAVQFTARTLPRVGTVASSATPAINVDSYDQFNITALAAAITSMTTNLTGTPVDGQPLRIRIKGDATPRAITWGASFQSSGTATLLATTAASKTHMVDLRYDAVAAKWICTGVDATGY